ncbi:inner centromere protein-like isoform X1 [Carcharodon carcharias]|uniref:inner centromere protein-like isoform X1 n=1 Tax=Carcharodon carcharias TaxID=13397 RepID=UPI001B7E6971|nr:inner centromere protein-like isoform X1 [Carcharodon carcharias]XP_041053732.1 inner centromere protein-like isoform X1 [Carcharodon carcharias]
MASRTAITLVDTDNMLKFFGEKLNTLVESFKANEVWLKEIQEEAKKMFISDFNAEPELMPKTPSERKRLRRRPSVTQDPNKRFSRSRKSLRRSSIQRPKHSNRIFVEDNSDCNKIVEQAHPVRLTRLASRAAAATASLETEKNNVCPIVPVNGRVPLVELSLNDCKSAELQKNHVANLAQTLLTFEDVNLIQKAVEVNPPPPSGPILETLTPAASAVNTISTNHEATKLKTDVTKENAVCGEAGSTNCQLSNAPSAGGVCIPGEDENKPVHNGTNCSLVRKSIASRRSSCVRLMDKYSLNVQRAAMVQESTRKSLRKSIARRKNILETSASSYRLSIEKVTENAEKECVEVIELEQPKQNQPTTLVPENQGRRCTRNATQIAMSNLEDNVSKPQASRNSPGVQRKESNNSDNQRLGCKNSCKQGVEDVLNSSGVLNCDDSPPRKKTPSSPCPASKVVRPKHKSFLHAVQKNQLLMTPVSVGRSMVKSFIKRNTPLKVDPKEKEKIRLENLKKKQEQEEERIQRVEEEKKHKLEELKKKREMRLKRVLETRSRVEQQEEEKRKRKIEQKNSQIDEKNEKMREERLAEEKAKKKVAAERMEEAETRRLQEEEIRKQKLQQLEEERQELLQRKKEEELERQCKMVEARKLQEQQQAELERERLHELQLAADRERERMREQESIQAEKERERLEKEKALQLQQELERTARENAALQAQREMEKLHEEAQEKGRKQEEQLPELKSQSLENERTTKQKLEQEKENRLCGDQQRKWKEEQDKVKEEVFNKNILNVTVELHHSPALESYTMTPNSYSKIKLPKVNLESYGMDLQSDDSTDDEGAPRKPIPSWANGKQLQQALIKQYYHPLDLDKFFGVIQPPNLEGIFGKSKPRYLKRTSSAVWQSPPVLNSIKNVSYGFMKY